MDETTKNKLNNEYQACINKINQLNIDIAKLEGKREEYEDRKIMLWDLLN